MRKKESMQDYVRIGNDSLETALSIFRFEENGSKIVYAPSLNVIGYGKTYDEADSDFEFCLSEFFRSTMSNGSFEREMEKLGWRMDKQLMTAPTMQELLPRDAIFLEMFNNLNYRKQNRSMSLSLA